MTRFLTASLTLLFALVTAGYAQDASVKKTLSNDPSATSVKKSRGPVFRATEDQIKQAQVILKQRNLYVGEQTGKLNAETRAGLKKYQESEKIKVTGTLNRMTLEKMTIPLTDKQKSM